MASEYKIHKCEANLVELDDLLAINDWTSLDLSHPRYLTGEKLIPRVSNSVMIDNSTKLFLTFE